MARIVVIGGEKGGVGKTTISTQMAALAAQEGLDVCLVNTDTQATASYWAATRKATAKVRSTIKPVHCVTLLGDGIADELVDLATRYALVIVDAGGRDSVEFRGALAVADQLVTPLAPSQFDVWTLPKLAELAKQVRAFNRRLVCTAVVSRVSHTEKGTARTDMASALADHPVIGLVNTVVVNRAAYKNASALGLSVAEMARRDVKAVTEMLSLYREIFNGKAAADIQAA